jgi:hypothetical protein
MVKYGVTNESNNKFQKGFEEDFAGKIKLAFVTVHPCAFVTLRNRGS